MSTSTSPVARGAERSPASPPRVPALVAFVAIRGTPPAVVGVPCFWGAALTRVLPAYREQHSCSGQLLRAWNVAPAPGHLVRNENRVAQRRPPVGTPAERLAPRRPRQCRRRSPSVRSAAARSSSMPRCSVRSEHRSSVNRGRRESRRVASGAGLSAGSSRSSRADRTLGCRSPGEARVQSAAARSRSRRSAFSSMRSSPTSGELGMRSSSSASERR